MLRRLVIVVLLFIVAILIAADRVGAHVASNVLADKLQTDEHFPNRPDTEIGGIPFLTQALRGTYRDVSVTEHGFVTTDGVRVSTLSANLHGVHIPLGKVVHGTVSQVPVDRVDGSVFVGFPDINNYLAGLAPSLTVGSTPNGGLRVVRRLTVGHLNVKLHGTATVGVIAGNVVTLSVTKIRAKHLDGHLPDTSPVLQPFTLQLPLRSLPFRMQLRSVQVQAGGIAGTGTASNVVLGS